MFHQMLTDPILNWLTMFWSVGALFGIINNINYVIEIRKLKDRIEELEDKE
jgi:hypothetical protein